MKKLQESFITAGLIVLFIAFPWLFLLFLGAFIKMLKDYGRAEPKQ